MSHDHSRTERSDGDGDNAASGRTPGTRTRSLALSRVGAASRSATVEPPDTAAASPTVGVVQRQAHAAPVDDPFAFHLMGNAGAGATEQIHAAAARGLAEPATSLPHADRIQASFGHHDVSSVQAHVGGAAASASAAMGADAYATGDHVAFAAPPDLHTAAHEAAHTVQQRAGVQLLSGVGEVGDPYERQADAVADRVVRGESAEDLLGEVAARGGGAVSALQHKKKPAATGEGDKSSDQPELVHDDSKPWPVFAKTGLPYIIESRGSKPGFWVARDWIVAEAGHGGKVMRAPGRARELLTAMGWVASAKMEFAAQSLTFEFHGALNHFTVGAEAAFATGLPGGRQAIVDRHRQRPDGLLVTLALDDPSLPPGAGYRMTTSETARAVQAAADFTGLAIDPAGAAFAMTRWVAPDLVTGNGVISVEFNRALCRTLFGVDAYDQWLGGPPIKQPAPDEPKTPKLKLENFYRRPIPGQLTHYGDVVESGEALRLEVLVDWPHHYPDAEIYDAPPMVTPSKFSNVAALQCTWRFERVGAAPDATAAPPAAATAAPASSVPTSAAAGSAGTTPGSSAPPAPAGALPGGAAAGAGPASAGAPAATAGPGAAPTVTAIETQTTTVAEAIHRFRLPPGEPTATFRVTCEARFDEYFAPATFTRDVVVMSSAAAMSKLKTEAFAGLGGAGLDRSQGSWTGDAKPGFRASPAAGTAEAIDDPMARDRAGQRERLHNVAEYLRDNPASAEATAALDREVARQERTEKLLAADRDKGWQPFQVRGTYLSRTEGLASGPLDLHGTVHVEKVTEVLDSDGGNSLYADSTYYVVRLRDLSRRFEQSDFVFEGRAASFDAALRQAFDDLAVAYPKGLVSIEAEQLRDSALADGATTGTGPGTGKVIGFQRSTETTWKKVKEVVWDPVASVVVNLGAIALMTLVPGSAVIVAPALVAYNTVPSIDRIATESARGTLTLGTFAMSTGEIALNLLPLVSSAKPLTAGWFMVETANWGGQVALMGAGAVDMARQLQATQVAALAVEYEAFLKLQKTSLPSDPGLAIAEDQIRRKAAALDGEISRQFVEQLRGNFVQMAAGSVIHHSSLQVRAAIVDHLTARPTATGPGDATTTGTGDGPASPAAPGDSGGPPRPGPDPTGTPPAGAAPRANAPASSLARDATADGRLRSKGVDEMGTDAAELHHIQRGWPGRQNGDTVSPIHYDPDSNTAYFDVNRGGERLRVTADVAPRITHGGELATSTNRVIGSPISAADGHRLLRELSEGRLGALSAVGVDVPPGVAMPLGTEFGLGATRDGRLVVVVGEFHAVDWAHLPGLEPRAHTHPSTPGNDLVKHTGAEKVPLSRIVEATPVPLIARELVMPSPADVAVMARLGVDGHRVITPFVVHDGQVMKPQPGDMSPRLEWVIEQPREVGHKANGDTVYEAVLVGEVGGVPVVQTKVWSTEPLTLDPDNPGSHFMSPPEMTPTTGRASAGTRTTPSGRGPDPASHADRLTRGAEPISAAEASSLAQKHGADALEWAGESLDGAPAKRMFDALEPAAIAGMRDVSAAESLANLDTFGKETIEKAVPPLTGRRLQIEREQLGGQAARGVAEAKLKGNKVDGLAAHADNLAAGTATPPTALTSGSLVVDTNVLSAIKELMGGLPWQKLDAHKKNGINFLRGRGKPPLPPLSGDPPARDAGSIIGHGHDLRAANNTLGESAPLAGLDRSGFELMVSRDSTQYKLALDELARPPAIGESKGEGDRAIVADTMFAASPGVPSLMTGDNAMIIRLFQKYGPASGTPIKPKHGQSLAQAIAARHPGGFQVVIPDGLGGTRTIVVIPMVK